MVQQLGYNLFLSNALKYGFSLWGLPKTGQTTKYKTGDDGDLEKGYPRTGPRFTNNGDGTITDNATGLMWVQEPGAIGGNFGSAGSPAKMTWNNAIDECLALSYAGHSDWRLPNAHELNSLTDYGRISPGIDPIFTNTQNDYYWSSSTALGLVTSAWRIYFYEANIMAWAKTTAHYPRPVRLNVS